MKILIKIIKSILTIAVLIILPVVVFTLITSKTPVVANMQSFVVLSGSMQPAIPVGSVVYTQKQTSYQKGDVIAFKSGDINITHRIVGIKEGAYQTKGDANNTADSKTINKNDVFGKEIFFAPYIGYAIIFLKTPVGFCSLIVFPLTVFIVLEFWNLKREIELGVERKLQKKMGLAVKND